VTTEAEEVLELLLPTDVLYEMILTSADVPGKPNAAPVGVRRKGSVIFIDLAVDTTSLKNILLTRSATLNAVYDPLVFAHAALGEMPTESFGAHGPNCVPVIRGFAAMIVLSLASRSDFTKDDELGPTQFARLGFNAEEVKVPGPLHPHTRRFSATIEAIIVVTKAEVAARRGITHILPDLKAVLDREVALAGRTGTDRATTEALRICRQRMESILRKEGHRK
jgi:hypothetical protein